jgi:hypothetical protein
MFAPDDLLLRLTNAQLAAGANFRLDTSLGPIDIMQWVAGISSDLAYRELAPQALSVAFRDAQIRVCGLEHLRTMKRAASRPQDLEDLRRLDDD